MKNRFKEKFNIYIYIIFVIILIFSITLTKDTILNNNTKTLKEMNESTQITDLNNAINTLQESHTDYSNYIQNCKFQIATAITNAGVETSSDSNIDTVISNIGKIHDAAYLLGTENGKQEGSNSTIAAFYKNQSKTFPHTILNSGSCSASINNGRWDSSTYNLGTKTVDIPLYYYIDENGTKKKAILNIIIINSSASAYANYSGIGASASTSWSVSTDNGTTIESGSGTSLTTINLFTKNISESSSVKIAAACSGSAAINGVTISYGFASASGSVSYELQYITLE